MAQGENMQINASGHQDQLPRQYGLLKLTGVAVTVNNAWAVLGSTISLALLNGGPPGIIYGLLVAALYYSFIGMSLAEFASSVPTSGGVYHWATIAAGRRWGRVTGFFTGWINFSGWMFALAALCQVVANVAVQMYAIYNPDYEVEAWHVYIAYLGSLWVSTAMVIFANRLIPLTQEIGMLLVVAGGVVTIIVISAMPSKHASDEFVWESMEENNLTGWPVGVAFMIGVLNGAFTLGTTDAVTHMAEEVSDPARQLPWSIALQIGLGTLYGFCYAVALSYAISNMAVVQDSTDIFPLATIYRQATGSAGGTFGLLFIVFFSVICGCIGTVLTNSRIYWALARDEAVPFSQLFGRVSERLDCPVEATLLIAVIATGLGAIPLGSTEGFSSLTGSFIILSTVSFAIPIVANLLAKRQRFNPGPFHLGRFGFGINTITILAIVLFDVLFCFPLSIPFDDKTMNYNCVILGGVVMLIGLWWALHARKHYPGPRIMHLRITDGVEVETGVQWPPADASNWDEKAQVTTDKNH